MRKSTDQGAGRKGRAGRRAWFVFLGSFLLCALYYGSWELWRWSNAPGFIILLGSLPWSFPWIETLSMGRSLVPIYLGTAITQFVVAFGFSLNCALIYVLLALARNKWFKPTASPPLRSGETAA